MPSLSNDMSSIILQVPGIKASRGVYVDKMAAGSDPDAVEAPITPENYHPPPQTYPGCFGLPYQDHNYGAPPPPTPPQSPPPVTRAPSPPLKVNGHIDVTTPETPLVVDHITEVIESVVNEVHMCSSEVVEDDDNNSEQWAESVTRCICGLNHDDGYMICCDKCSVWQHIDCVMLDRTNIPETYFCEECEPRDVDKERALRIQHEKLANMSDSSTDSENEPTYQATSTTPTSLTLTTLKKKTKSGKKNRRDRDRGSTEKKKKKAKKEKKDGKELGDSAGQKENTEHKKKAQQLHKFREGARKSTRMKPPKKHMLAVPEGTNDPWDCTVSPWTDEYEESQINQYCAEIQDKIITQHNNGFPNGPVDLSALDQLLVQRCKVAQVANNRKGLETTSPISGNHAIIEYKGVFLLRQQFDKDDEFFKRLYPFCLFYPNFEGLDICVDAGAMGNDARFVRRSCTPNAEIHHLVEGSNLHLYLYSSQEIASGAEVTIPFDYNYQDCDYCVECACNRSQCPVRKFNKQLKEQKEQQSGKAKVVKKKRTKSGEGGDPPIEILESSSVTEGTHVKPEPPSKKQKTQHKVLGEELEVETVVTPKKEQPEPSVHPEEYVHPEHFEKEETGDTATTNEDEAEKKRKEKERQKHMTREERKMEAIMKAFEKLEKREERRKEALARIEHRKSQDKPHQTKEKEDGSGGEHQTKGNTEPVKTTKSHKKGKGKGTSTPSRRRSRMNSGNSDAVLSPDESSNLSMPGTPLHMVDLVSMQTPTPEKAFRFPKTKKHLMNEWLMEKAQDIKPLSVQTEALPVTADQADFVVCVPSPHSSLSHLRRDSMSLNSSKGGLNSSIGTKKRWLRQAMYESNNTVVTGGSGNSSPIPNGGMSPNPHVSHPSPSASPPVDFVTPLKKRRMARESLSAENAPGLPPTPSTPSTDFISSEKVDIGNQPLLDIRVTAKTKNGFRQHLSPITPLTPGTENLFEKFDHVSGDLQRVTDIRKQESMESNVSESLLSTQRQDSVDNAVEQSAHRGLAHNSDLVEARGGCSKSDTDSVSTSGASPGHSRENGPVVEQFECTAPVKHETNSDVESSDNGLRSNGNLRNSNSSEQMEVESSDSLQLQTHAECERSSSTNFEAESSGIVELHRKLDTDVEETLNSADQSSSIANVNGSMVDSSSFLTENCVTESSSFVERRTGGEPQGFAAKVDSTETNEEVIEPDGVSSCSIENERSRRSEIDLVSQSEQGGVENTCQDDSADITSSSSENKFVNNSREQNDNVDSLRPGWPSRTSEEAIPQSSVVSSVTDDQQSNAEVNTCVDSSSSARVPFAWTNNVSSTTIMDSLKSSINENDDNSLSSSTALASDRLGFSARQSEQPDTGSLRLDSSHRLGDVGSSQFSESIGNEILTNSERMVSTSNVAPNEAGPSRAQPGECATSDCDVPPPPPPPAASPAKALKKRVSLLEYRKRMKGKSLDSPGANSAPNSASSTPTKAPSSISFPSSLPNITPTLVSKSAPSLAPLPLFESSSPAKSPSLKELSERLLSTNPRKDRHVVDHNDVRWNSPGSSNNTPGVPPPPAERRPSKQLSLMERLRQEFGLEDEEEDKREQDPHSPRSRSETPPPPPPPEQPPPPPPPAKQSTDGTGVFAGPAQGLQRGPGAASIGIPSLMTIPPKYSQQTGQQYGQQVALPQPGTSNHPTVIGHPPAVGLPAAQSFPVASAQPVTYPIPVNNQGQSYQTYTKGANLTQQPPAHTAAFCTNQTLNQGSNFNATYPQQYVTGQATQNTSRYAGNSGPSSPGQASRIPPLMSLPTAPSPQLVRGSPASASTSSSSSSSSSQNQRIQINYNHGHGSSKYRRERERDRFYKK